MRFFIFLFLLFIFRPVFAVEIQTLEVDLIIHKEDFIRVTETYHFTGEEGIPSINRTLFSGTIPYMYPLRKRISNITLKDSSGNKLEFSQYKYGGERNYIRFPELKPGTKKISFSYDYYYSTKFENNEDIIKFEFVFFYLPIKINMFECRLKLPAGLSLNTWDVENWITKDKWLKQGDGSILLRFDLSEEKSPWLKNTLHLSKGVIKRPYLKTLFKEFFIQGRVLPYIFILASVLAIVCRFLPLQFSILFIRLLNLSTFVLVSFFFLEWSRFWLLNPALKMDENRISHILTDLAGNMTLLIVFGMFYFHLENLLKQKKRESYHVPFASPLFYFSILPLSTLEPAILYLYILSLTVYFVWTREILSIYYGNSSYKIIERVEEEGKLNITELLKLFPVGERRLYELISSMEGELIIKKEENMVYSPSALQFEEGHRLCRNCGAYNELNTGNIITCPYCEVEYHKSISEKKKKKPIPVVVETFSYIVNMFKFPVLTWGLTFMLVGITSEASSRDGDIFLGIFLGGGIFALSVYISIMYIEVLAKQLIEGKRYMTAMLINIFLLFLFVPLYYLRKLNTKRALYHFDELEKNEIQNYINKNKDISIPEFAKFLQVSDSEAYDFARYLSQNNLISSVYDRQKNRLINKQLFQRSSGEKSCVHCGGKYSILQGKAVCQYCGHIRN